MCNTVANYFWKIELAKNPFDASSLGKILSTFFSLNIIIGIFFYITSMMLFLYMLTHFKLSIIAPLTAMTYIFNISMAYLLFREKVHAKGVIGAAVIIIGIIILSQTPAAISE